MDDYTFGFYAARVLAGGADVRVISAFGWQDFDMIRRWDINALDLYRADFKGNTTATTFELGKRMYRGPWSIRPVVGLDLLTSRVKAAKEDVAFEINAGEQAVAYGKGKFTQTFMRFGSDLRYDVRNVTFNSGLYYAYDMNGKDMTARVRGISDGNRDLTANLVGGKFGRSQLTFNSGADLKLARNLSLFGGYEGSYYTDRSNSKMNSAGHIGLGFGW